MAKSRYHCGPFDLDGFATDTNVYPPQWKAAMFFISLGFAILSGTVLLTLVTCCRQALLGKSIHNITGSAQVVAGNTGSISSSAYRCVCHHLLFIQVFSLCWPYSCILWAGERQEFWNYADRMRNHSIRPSVTLVISGIFFFEFVFLSILHVSATRLFILLCCGRRSVVVRLCWH